MSTAIYAFSGDPITYGHIDIIKRAGQIFDQVIVAIGVNPSKKYMFSLEEREVLAKSALSHLPYVQVKSFRGLLVDFAYEMGVKVIVKGVRSSADADYEQTLHSLGSSQKLGIETVILFAKPELSHISSSTVKQIQCEQGLIHEYVPLNVKQALEEKMSGQYIVGVTGEIGVGKSYVCEQLQKLAMEQGIAVHNVDMDAITHQILSKLTEPRYQQLRQEIIADFGKQVANKDGSINRKILGEIVFNDYAKLQKLNNLMYQPLLVRLRREFYGKKGLILLNAALIIESELSSLCNDHLILVNASDSVQKARLSERGLDQQQIDRRLQSAYPFDQKKAKIEEIIAHNHFGKVWQIDNSNEQNKQAIKDLLAELINFFSLKKQFLSNQSQTDSQQPTVLDFSLKNSS